jgi:hypothetical protein
LLCKGELFFALSVAVHSSFRGRNDSHGEAAIGCGTFIFQFSWHITTDTALEPNVPLLTVGP